MFRSRPYLEETKYVRILLNTPIVLPVNNQFQRKNDYIFAVTDRDNVYDWYNAYIRADFKFEAKANGGNIAADTESAPINGSFSLIKSLKVISSGKNCTRQVIFTKVFSSKICLIFQMIFQEVLQKTNFGILTLTLPQTLMAMRQTPECGQGRFYHREV